MRKRTPKLVISFSSATEAMMFESAVSPQLGRIIPLPAKINAGCGLAFCTDPKDEEKVMKILRNSEIKYHSANIIELF
ncbi:MAG: DUF3343 domain-containing protein [Defluviitaleaceae bacterium]|nr:DUF3343 domain-containing protein [Defluviitaleaceae bacterium]